MFEKFINVSKREIDTHPLQSVSIPSYTWQCGLKCTDIKIQTLQDKDMIQFFEKNNRGGIRSVYGDRYVAAEDNIKILYIDANNLYDIQ